MEKNEDQHVTPRYAPKAVSRKIIVTALALGAAIAVSLYHKSPFSWIATTAPSPILNVQRDVESLDRWLESERPIAIQGILDNIGSFGAKVAGAQSGVVVASPSKSDPDYFYTWTRDSALTIKTLMDEFIIHGTSGLDVFMQNYIDAQAVFQDIDNPSGGICSGGLGEAKFNVDETAFTGSWGRPQRDGPALRAIAMIGYARRLIAHGHNDTVTSVIWPILQNDLSYVTQYWNQTTFDLWEEVNGASFFTTGMQYRALIEGLDLAQEIGKTCDHCASQAPQILCFLQSYWTGSYILSNTGGGRSGKDLNSILTSTHMFDIEAGCDAATFQPCSDKALANHKAVTDSFRSVYAVNRDILPGVGVAIGRYAEDMYMGGNPWYLGAFAAAEMLYQAVLQWQHCGSINVTSTSLAFFQDVYPCALVEEYTASSPEFDDIVRAVTEYADSYMANVQNYTPADGSLAEQYSRDTGSPLSAKDLTWSYAAFLTAYEVRKGNLPHSWGASPAPLPGTCVSSSATGPCGAAANVTWPDAPPELPCTTTESTTLMFSVLRATNPGQNVFLVGSTSQLGEWDVNKALPMSAGKYTNENPTWYAFESLFVNATLEYKYIVKDDDDDGAITWETGSNREYTVPASCAVSVAVDDEWK